jgi:hypothetical protein
MSNDKKENEIDELVHEHCGVMAKQINEAGTERQIKFLEANGVDCEKFKPPPPRIWRETPGPWRYSDGRVVVDTEKGEGVICKMDRSTEASKYGINPINRDANAKLIARLPDILAIAHYMEGVLKALDDVGLRDLELTLDAKIYFRKIRQTLRDTPGDS